MACKEIKVWHWGDDDWPPLGEDLEFTLVYEGPLLAHNEVRHKAAHKHSIRKQFHPQLRLLWQQKLNHWLVSTQVSKLQKTFPVGPPVVDTLAENFLTGPYGFVPLVTQQLVLACKLDILFLRRDAALGKIIQGGDIDNRIKTLFDALRWPTKMDEMGGEPIEDDERPFFCLLEDDGLITEVNVRADTLLTPPSPAGDDVKLIIRVVVRPIEMHPFNADFA